MTQCQKIRNTAEPWGLPALRPVRETCSVSAATAPCPQSYHGGTRQGVEPRDHPACEEHIDGTGCLWGACGCGYM